MSVYFSLVDWPIYQIWVSNRATLSLYALVGLTFETIDRKLIHMILQIYV